MSGEPKTLTQMTPREAWEHAWEQAIDACRVFEEEAAAKQLEAVRNLGRQMLDQDQEEEGVPVVARDEAAELRAENERMRKALNAVDSFLSHEYHRNGHRLTGKDWAEDVLRQVEAITRRRLAGGEGSDG